MTKDETVELYRTQIDDLLEAVGLTDWEATFLDSIDNQLESRGDLTLRQAEILEKIWTKFNARKERNERRP